MASLKGETSNMTLEALRNSVRSHVERLVAMRRPHETRQQLAKRVGIGDGTLGRLLGPDANPRLDTLQQLAVALKMSPSDLLKPSEAQSVRESPAPYPIDVLTAAIEDSEKIIQAAGSPQLSAEARAAIISTVLRLQSEGVGMDSARDIVAKLLATTSGAKKHGTTG